jgi:putative SOS response-associated peptidase YedK
MCGRARCVLTADAIEKQFNVPKSQFKDFQNYQPKENMTPGSQIPVLYIDQNSGARVLQIMTWGLIPSFTSSQVEKPDFFKMFNARLETIDEKPSFRKIAKTNRCVVLLNGYFEWKQCSDTGRKQPYYVSRQDGHPFCLAGVYDTWKVRRAV